MTPPSDSEKQKAKQAAKRRRQTVNRRRRERPASTQPEAFHFRGDWLSNKMKVWL